MANNKWTRNEKLFLLLIIVTVVGFFVKGEMEINVIKDDVEQLKIKNAEIDNLISKNAEIDNLKSEIANINKLISNFSQTGEMEVICSRGTSPRMVLTDTGQKLTCV